MGAGGGTQAGGPQAGGALGQLANPQMRDNMQNKNNQGLPGMRKPTNKPPAGPGSKPPMQLPMKPPPGGPQPAGGAGAGPMPQVNPTTVPTAPNRGPLAGMQADRGRLSGMLGVPTNRGLSPEQLASMPKPADLGSQVAELRPMPGPRGQRPPTPMGPGGGPPGAAGK